MLSLLPPPNLFQPRTHPTLRAAVGADIRVGHRVRVTPPAMRVLHLCSLFEYQALALPHQHLHRARGPGHKSPGMTSSMAEGFQTPHQRPEPAPYGFLRLLRHPGASVAPATGTQTSGCSDIAISSGIRLTVATTTVATPNPARSPDANGATESRSTAGSAHHSDTRKSYP